ncbi:MAG: hypothetical protein Kow0059_07720 [Candidatus Sumerlaeia bacterium]
MTIKNAYDVLNIRKGATEEDIKKAYVELVKRYDPEMHTDRFMMIKKAYDMLRDPRKRAKEDLFTFNYIKGEFHFTPDERDFDEKDAGEERIRELERQWLADKTNEQVVKEFVLAMMRKSYREVQRKLWAEAISSWNTVLKADPTHFRAKNNLTYSYITLGFSYANHDLLNEAIDLWEKAIKMNPDNQLLLHNLAIAYEKVGKKDQAEHYWAETIKRWKEQLEREPDNEYLKTLIIEIHKHHGGRALETKKEPAQAIEEYREILKINPNDFEAQYQIALSLYEEQKWDEAIAELKKLSQQYPKNVEVLNLLGWALLNAGQVDAAFMQWKKSLQQDPKNPNTRQNIINAHLTLGKTLREKGLLTPSLVHFKALMRYLPQNPEVHMEIGKTYMLKGEYRQAFHEFKTVLDLDPKNQVARKMLSELRMRR